MSVSDALDAQTARIEYGSPREQKWVDAESYIHDWIGAGLQDETYLEDWQSLKGFGQGRHHPRSEEERKATRGVRLAWLRHMKAQIDAEIIELKSARAARRLSDASRRVSA